MYRILYQDLAGNFNISNAGTPMEMERSAFEIASAKYIIICIYDYQHKRTLFECLKYNLYWSIVNELVYENKQTA
ncbi:hypothetical protein SAMN06265348_11161 [Pedobacter westerhofensis]|uniref:Uncharacterized protein n=1 Tax=Pedobacter westerhofensis TaxID=425512 RepID=A0A521FBQ4_9SPHI|nr:hypothetical protein [Pedobacter westerhofensis]SMO93556.1 hypothetical protein SAMN06265348_11161 [Pedobacter westerhofensis]